MSDENTAHGRPTVHHREARWRRRGVLVAFALCIAAVTTLAAPTVSGAAPGSSWTQLGGDIDGTSLRDLAGSSVAVSSDGRTVAIGAPTDGQRIYSGYVRVLRHDGSGWNQLGADIVGGVRDHFGWSVALSDDGNTVAIGAIYNGGPGSGGAGYARVLRFDGGGWSPLGADIDGEAGDDRAGWSVALSSDGNTVAVGAPQNSDAGDFAGHVRVFRLDAESWSQVGADIDAEAAGDQFGTSVALSNDGDTVAVGGPTNDGGGASAGHTRILHLVDDVWVQLGADVDGEAADDRSGDSVALSDDGNTVAVGAPNHDPAGQVRVLRLAEGSWTPVGAAIDGEISGGGFGSSVALSSDGGTIAIGAPDDNFPAGPGHVRVLRLAEGSWQPYGPALEGETDDDYFGGAVALSSDGETIAVGAPFNDASAADTGHVRVFASVVVPDVTITGTSHTYDGSPHAVSVETDPPDLDHVVTYDGSQEAPTDAGTYDVEVRITEDGHVTEPDPVTATLTIEEATQSIDFAALEDRTFGDDPFDVAATATSGLDVGYSAAGACTLTGSTVTITAAGECAITANQPGDDNHSAADPVAQTFSIARADAMVEITDAHHTYDGTPHGAAVSTSPSGLAVTITYDGSTEPPTDAGSYEISVVVDDPNYDATPVLATLSIDPATQIIAIDAPSSIAVDGEPVDVATTSSAGLDVALVSTGPCTIDVATVTPTGIGDCLITGTQDGDVNHDAAAPVTASIAITTATLSITGLPEQVRPGDSITVELTGFGATETIDLVLRSEPVNVSRTDTDGRGAATATFIVPRDLSAGRHTLTASGRTSDRTVAESVVVVLANAAPTTPTDVGAGEARAGGDVGTGGGLRAGTGLPITGTGAWFTSFFGLLLLALGLALLVVSQGAEKGRRLRS